MISLAAPPYSEHALEPFLSAETMDYHYHRHQRNYVTKLNQLIAGTRYDDFTIEELIHLCDGEIYFNAAQAWNHDFYWRCMRSPLLKEVSSRLNPESGMPARLANQINLSFGSIRQFKTLFKEKAMTVMGSGWVWLIHDRQDCLRILTLPNCESPLRLGLKPVLTCDIWEHAYYIDYRNDRGRYVEGFLNSINWDFVNGCLVSDAVFSSATQSLMAKKNSVDSPNLGLGPV